MDIQALNKKKTIGFVFLTWAVCCLMTQSLYAQDANVEQLLHRGLTQQKGRPLEETKEIFQKVVTLDPGSDRAWYELAKINFSEKAYDASEEALRMAIKSKPDSTIYWLSLADVYKASEQFKPLSEVYDQLIQLQPKEQNHYLDKAYALYLGKQHQEALKVYDDAARTFGLNASIVAGKNTIFLHNKKPNKAFKATKELLRQEPERAEAYLMLSNLYLTREHPKKALHVLNEIERQFDQDARIPLSKSAALRQQGQWDKSTQELHKVFKNSTLTVNAASRLLLSILSTYPEALRAATAITLAEDLVRTHKDNAQAYAVLGDMLIRADKKQEAATQLEKALKLNNKMPVVWEEYLQLELNLGRIKSLQEKGKEAVALFPSNTLIALFTGFGYMLDNNPQEARPYMESALNSADPNDKELMAQIYSSLGSIYNGLEMHEVSDVAFEESLAIDSNNSTVLNNYAYFLSLRKENLDRALHLSKRANTLSPNNPTFQDTYAWTLFQQQQYEQALQWMEKALDASEQASATMLQHYGDILLMLHRREDAIKNWKLALKMLPENEDKTRNLILKKIKDTSNEN